LHLDQALDALARLRRGELEGRDGAGGLVDPADSAAALMPKGCNLQDYSPR